MTNPANAASREARVAKAISEPLANMTGGCFMPDNGRSQRGDCADGDCYCARVSKHCARAAIDALADEAASQPREGVDDIEERLAKANAYLRSEGWREADGAIGYAAVRALLASYGRKVLHDTAPTDQAQRGGEVDRDALIAAAWKSIDEGDASGLGHASFPTIWGRNEDPHVCYVDGTFHLGDLVDAILAALAQSEKGVE